MVMDGRRPAGIMGGEDPYADPRLAAVYRALAESPDTAYRASMLPFRRTTAGATELAVPGFLMDAARGAVDLLAGPHTGQMSPEATQSIMGFAGSSAMQAPTPGLLAAIKAYHGSPHAFDRFDMSKIGTGEGVQAYGHGLYFAGEKDIAKHYQDTLSRKHTTYDGQPPDWNNPAHIAASWTANFGGDRAAAIDYLRKAPIHEDDARDAIQLLESGAPLPVQARTTGSLYHVTLSPDEEDLLDWDAPLSQQPEKVLQALKKIDAPYGNTGFSVKDVVETIEVAQKDAKLAYLLKKPPFSDKGQHFIRSIGDKQYHGGPEASRMLKEAGIPGLRFFDGASRDSGAGTRNYVMFDDKLVNIDKVER